MTDQPAPTYLAPVQEIDRLRAENARLSATLGRVGADKCDAETEAAQAVADLVIAEVALEEAEARVDQLTDQLTLANDTLRHRGEAVNATGATNDTLRATLAAVSRFVGMLSEGIEAECDPCEGVCHGFDVVDETGLCALVADLERIRAIIRGDAK